MGPYNMSDEIDKRVDRARQELSRWKLESIQHRVAADACVNTNLSNSIAAANCCDLAEINGTEVGVLTEIGPPQTAEKTLESVVLISRLERLAAIVKTTLSYLNRPLPQA
jgi:hypothetical protein